MSQDVARTETRHSPHARIMGPEALPMELLTQVLSHLTVPSRRAASGVSRRFYAAAWNAGLSIDRRIVLEQSRSCGKQLAEFRALVQHALPKNLRLKLSVHTMLSLTSTSPRISNEDEKHQMRDIMSAITPALPLLIYLEVDLADWDDDIAAALCHPAPHLQNLLLSRSVLNPACKPILPPELFAGHAPLLRAVLLGDVHLPAAQVPVFNGVTSLQLANKDSSFYNIPLARDFPRLSALTLYAAPVELPQGLLKGLNLRSLIVEGGINAAEVLRSLDIDKIPDVRVACDDILWIEPESDTAVEFSLRLQGNLHRHVELSIIIVPAHRHWRRIYDMSEWLPDSTLSIDWKPGGGPAHLTYVRVESTFLHSFLACNTALPALRVLKVDLDSQNDHPATVWPPDMLRPHPNLVFSDDDKTSREFHAESTYRVPCAALEEVVLFALDETITVQSREVAFLGRALGQVARPKHTKAALVLVGIELAKPEARRLLDQTFSDVRRRGFCGWHSKEDGDEGLWASPV